jgi:hypothetical protein
MRRNKKSPVPNSNTGQQQRHSVEPLPQQRDKGNDNFATLQIIGA